MTSTPPQQFTHLYANDKAPGQSLEEKIDLKVCGGHIMRDSAPGKFIVL